MRFPPGETQPERTLLATSRTTASILIASLLLERLAIVRSSVLAGIIALLAAVTCLIQLGASTTNYKRTTHPHQTHNPTAALLSAASVVLISTTGLIIANI